MTGLASVTVPRGGVSTWGRQIDEGELQERVSLCRSTSSTTREKGHRLEQLIVWLLPYLPGFEVRKTNIFSSNQSQEIDILIWNEKMAGGFPSFGEKIIVECKNWERKVDSSDIAWFYWKMRFGGAHEGILIAANGVTGELSRRQAAQGIITLANAESPSKKIFIITLDEISRIGSYVDLRKLLIDKSMDLTAQAALT